MMKSDIIEAYIEKVYGYAVNHTYSRDEADELSQEILLTAVRELPKLRDDSKIEPWLWGVARACLKKAFCQVCVPLGGRFSSDEGGVAVLR